MLTRPAAPPIRRPASQVGRRPGPAGWKHLLLDL